MATTAVIPKKDQLPEAISGYLKMLMPDVYRLLPPDITSDQFRASCWLELTSKPDVHEWVIESIRDAIIYAANYGLMPGRDCHFLPFKNRRYRNQKAATCVTNYFGIIRTLDRSGKVRRAFAHPVHDGDEFAFDYFQDRPFHRPAITLGKKPGKERFYYGAVMFKDGTCAFEVLTLDDLDAIRKRAPAHDSGPWVEDPVMMKRKSAIKRVAKYVQLTPDLRALLTDDDTREQEDIPLARQQQNIIDLYGPAVDPTAHSQVVDAQVVSRPSTAQAQHLAADYIPRIEAAILATPGGNVAHWHTWATRHFHKEQSAFTEADWQAYLAQVQAMAQVTQPSTAPAGPEPEGQEPAGAAPTFGPGSPDLFAREEVEASEYGE